jgi:hypothetical protein
VGGVGPPALHEAVPLTDLGVVGPRQVEDDEVKGREAQPLPERLDLQPMGGREDLLALPAQRLGACGVHRLLVADQQNGAVDPWGRHGT